MQSGEFPKHNPNSDITANSSEIKTLLETLSLEDTEALCDSLYRQTTDEWERCNNSFGALFDRLNLFNTRELSLFDILLDQDEETSNEVYMRVQKSKDGSYSTSQLVRNSGQIIERGQVEKFSDTYEYRFGSDEDHVATLTIKDHDTSGVQLVQADGEYVARRTKAEMDIIVCALELTALPAIERSRLNLVTLWNAVQNIEHGTR